MRKSLLFLTLSILFNAAHSQNQLVKQWDYRFGGLAHDQTMAFIHTADGGFLMGGYSASGIGGNKTQGNRDSALASTDYWIVKTDASGIMQWDKRFGGDKMDKLTSMIQTTDGGYLLGGYSNSQVSGDKTQPGWSTGLTNDYWVVKTDGFGIIQWDKRFGGTNDDKLQSVHQTADGGYIIGGYSSSGTSGDRSEGTQGGTDYWIVKTDFAGNIQWDKRYGGMYDDYLYTIKQTSDGGYILGGSSWSYVSGDKTQAPFGLVDFWLVKADSLGNKQWDRVFGGTESDDCYSMDICFNGGYILGGLTNSGISGNKTQPIWGYSDFWIVKVDDTGNLVWDKGLGGYAGEDEFCNISALTDGGYLIAGTSYSDIGGNKTEDNLGPEQPWMIKTDSSGNVLWDKTVLLNDHIETGFGVQTMDGCYAFATYTLSSATVHKSQPSWGSVDYWMIKFCDTTTILASVPGVNMAASDTSLCAGNCVNFSDLSTNNPTSWHWLFPGSATAFSTNKNPVNVCYNGYGNYDVTLIACNAAGCDTLTFPGYIHVDNIPSLSLGADTVLCSGDSLVLDAGAGYSSYQWSNNATTQSITISQPGIYVIDITAGNCAAKDSIDISYQPCGTATVAMFNSSDTTFCEKSCLDFYDLSTNNPVSWSWFFPGSDSLTSQEQNPKGICYNSYGMFDVTLIACNASGCDTLYMPGFIHEFQSPPLPVVTISGDTLFSTPAFSYQWYFNSAGIVGATNSWYVSQQQGNYFVVVTDSNGCASSSNVFFTGIGEAPAQNHQLFIFPNPSAGNFRILFSQATHEAVRGVIYDITGRSVHEMLIPEGTIEQLVDLRSVTPGIYLVEMQMGNSLEKCKLVISR